MEAITGTLVNAAAPLIATAIIALLTFGVNELAKYLRSKTSNEAAQNLITLVDGFATKAVQSTEQTVVDPMKANNSWLKPGAYQLAMDSAVANFKVLGGQFIPQLVAQGIADVDTYIRTLLESKLKALEPTMQLGTAMQTLTGLGTPAGVPEAPKPA